MIAFDVTRASAFVAFGAYTLSITWGVLVASRTLPAPAKPEFDLHRFLSSVGLAATLVHVLTVLETHANGIHWPALFYVQVRPAAVAAVTATWLILALPVSFVLKRRGKLTAAGWRNLHYLGYAVWVLSLLHALGAGSDSHAPAVVALYAISGGMVASAVAWRVGSRRARAATRPTSPP
jgi:DMSO/TMAO reductase YedYZ heme-binding membrane subunit